MAKVYLTAEQIWKACYHASTDLSERVMINRLYRAQDDSSLWPICGKFNVTERAIRAARKKEKKNGYMMHGLEYCLFLEDEMSKIVNNPKNM
jgi:hypothetical protein